jgi:hypothetical protein
MDWSLNFDPTDSITRVPNSTTANGIQGIYEAVKTGTTTLSAMGQASCARNEVCPTFVVESKVTLVVD